MKDRGFIHIYTGNGKGKTTAAFGVAIRSLEYGYKVYIGQFIKGMKYNETKMVERYSNIKIEQYGTSCFIDRDIDEEDRIRAKEGLNKFKEILKSEEFDLVIADELNIALYFKLIKIEDVLELFKIKPEKTELILTGRYAPKKIIENADLVTEMVEIKHYYQKGVLSRGGIDK